MTIKGGHEAPYRPDVLLKATGPILCAIMFERFAYYLTGGNLQIYLTQRLGLSSLRATQIQSIQSALIYIIPIFGGIVSDIGLGRVKTPFIAGCVACIGAAIMSVASSPSRQESLSWLFLLALLGIFSPGASTFVPPLVVLGGDQYPESEPKILPKRKLYFDLIYLLTNVGALVSFVPMSSVMVSGMGIVTSKWSWTFGFSMTCAFYGLAALVLASFQKNYWVKHVEADALEKVFHVTKSALLRRTTYRGVLVICSIVMLILGFAGSVGGYFYDSFVYQCITAAITVVAIGIVATYGGNQDWVNDALGCNDHGAKFDDGDVQNVADTFRVLPFMSISIPFWAIYNQMNNNYILQGCQMRSPWSFVVSSTMNVFDSLGCILFISMLNAVAVPIAMKVKWPLTNMRRLAIGFVAAACAMAAAAIVESMRKKSDIATTLCTLEMTQLDQPTCLASEVGLQVKKYSKCVHYDDVTGWPAIYESEMNIFWLVPQYMLIALGEILVAPTLYDVFYAEVSPSLRTLCGTVNFLSTAFGFLIGGVVNTLMASMIPNDLNDGHLEYVYVLWVILPLLTCCFQIYSGRKFGCRADIVLMDSLKKEPSDSANSKGGDNIANREAGTDGASSLGMVHIDTKAAKKPRGRNTKIHRDDNGRYYWYEEGTRYSQEFKPSSSSSSSSLSNKSRGSRGSRSHKSLRSSGVRDVADNPQHVATHEATHEPQSPSRPSPVTRHSNDYGGGGGNSGGGGNDGYLD